MKVIKVCGETAVALVFDKEMGFDDIAKARNVVKILNT